VCLASLFSRWANKDIIENFGILSKSAKFTSDEEAVKKFRKNWHMYYVNRELGEFFWRHIPCDFTKVPIPGYLHTKEKNFLTDGSEYFFEVEAAIRENVLISIHSIEGKDNLVRIFPSIKNESLSGYYCGFICLTTLDNTGLLGPTILAKDSSKFGEEPTIKNPQLCKDRHSAAMSVTNHKFCTNI
jgi:hypothetical protein